MKSIVRFFAIPVSVLLLGYVAFIATRHTGDARPGIPAIDTAHAAPEIHDHEAEGADAGHLASPVVHDEADTDHDHEAEITGHDEAPAEPGHDEHEAGAAALVYSDSQRAEYGIEVLLAGPGDIVTTVAFPGEVVLDMDRSAPVVPRMGGVVTDVRASLGDRVRAGDVLAVIQSRERAETVAAFATWRERAALAATIFERETALREKDVSSDREVEDARIALTEARIEMDSARRSLNALGLTDADLTDDALASGASSLHEVRSPLDGTVIDRSVTRGAVVTGDTPVFVVADLAALWVDFQVGPSDITRIPTDGPVTITSLDGDRTATAEIIHVARTLDPSTRTVLLRARLANDGGDWRPGEYVAGAVASGHDTANVVIPSDSVQLIEGLPVVFIDTPEGFVSRDVTTGRRAGDHVEITAGLVPGEPYVSRGAFTLKARIVTSSLGAHAGHGH